MLLTIIIGIVLFGYFFDQLLEIINQRSQSEIIPNSLKGLFTKEEHKKNLDYKRTNFKFSLLTSFYGLFIVLLMLVFKGFAFIDNIASGLSSNNIIIALIFFGIIMFASDLLNLPFSIYGTFHIEQKFGFNKSTPKIFIQDKLKSWLLGAIIGTVLLFAIISVYNWAETYFWLLAWAIVSLFSIFMNIFYTSLIVPLFNKLSPLEEGELKDAINKMCKKAEFELDSIFVIDGSKRSTKANAYFSGLGKRKKIVLYDTLIEDLEIDELVAVLAHEIGHYKKKHIIKGLISSVLQTGILFYIFSLFVDNPKLAEALGAEEASFHLGVITFGFLYSPISLLTGIFFNIFSRKNEYEADSFAKTIHSGENLISALIKLTRKNSSNLTPHPFYVFINYSHPPLIKRIEELNK